MKGSERNREALEDGARGAAIYDRLAGSYDRAIAPLEKRFLARWRAEALRELPPDSRILEVGAGTGLNFPFNPRGARGGRP